MDRIIGQGPLTGVLEPPADKSISHRALMLSAMATGVSRVSNLLLSKDVLSTQSSLQALGVPIAQTKEAVQVEGLSGKLKQSIRPIQCGNSGTTMRLLTGILAAQAFSSVLVGDDSLSRRPMERILKPLRMMGAAAFSSSAGGPPVFLKGSRLHGIEYHLPVPSAQLKSAILLAAIQAEGETIIHEPTLSRNHTEIMMQRMGIKIVQDIGCIAVSGPQLMVGGDYRVPGDFSSAAPFVLAAAVTEGSRLHIRNVGLNPTRTGMLHVLRRMGASIEVTESQANGTGQELVGDILVQAANLSGTEIPAEEIPLMIDEIPLLVVAACLAKGKTVIRGASELRIKESDRIEGIACPLSSMGAKLRVEGDDIIILGPSKLIGRVVSSSQDHRLAMALAVAALNARGPVTIQDSEWVDISFPAFWQELERLQEGK